MTTQTEFPAALSAGEDDDPAKPWRVRDEYGNALDFLSRSDAREVMRDQLASAAVYERRPDGTWLLFETLLRG